MATLGNVREGTSPSLTRRRCTPRTGRPSPSSRRRARAPARVLRTDLYHGWLAPRGPRFRASGPRRFAPRFRQIRHGRTVCSLRRSRVRPAQARVSAHHAMQDMSVECGDGVKYAAAHPSHAAASSIRCPDSSALQLPRVYEEIHDDRGPKVGLLRRRGRLSERLSVRSRSRRHRADEVAGRRLTQEQLRYIELVGRGQAHADTPDGASSVAIGGDERAERGVAIVTDIHTNVGQGNCFGSRWAPSTGSSSRPRWRGTDAHPRRGVLVFIRQPMAERMTDASGASSFERKLPDSPPWTRSFIERKP